MIDRYIHTYIHVGSDNISTLEPLSGQIDQFIIFYGNFI